MPEWVWWAVAGMYALAVLVYVLVEANWFLVRILVKLGWW